MKERIYVGLIGFGTIGRGVVRWMLEKTGTFMVRKGFELALLKIADLDIETSRGMEVPVGMLTTDARDVLEDEDIDIVVELIGGLEPARTFVLEALNRGKGVVTANKALLSKHGDELFRAAYERVSRKREKSRKNATATRIISSMSGINSMVLMMDHKAFIIAQMPLVIDFFSAIDCPIWKGCQ